MTEEQAREILSKFARHAGYPYFKIQKYGGIDYYMRVGNSPQFFLSFYDKELLDKRVGENGGYFISKYSALSKSKGSFGISTLLFKENTCLSAIDAINKWSTKYGYEIYAINAANDNVINFLENGQAIEEVIVKMDLEDDFN